MKKTISLAALALMCSSSSWAADNATLEKQVQELIQQNKMLLERISNLEKMVGTAAVGERCDVIAEPGKRKETDLAKQPSGPAVDSLNERLRQVERVIEKTRARQEGDEEISILGPGKCKAQIGGLIELEAFSKDDFNQEETSDISLATVELSLDVHPTNWSHGRLVLLYEEGEEDDHIIVDEGTVTLGNMELFPATLTVGKKYLPFGSYLTSMISDPLPLELGETSDTTAQVDFQVAGLYGSAYVFNGDINETGEDDKIDTFGAALGYADVIGEISYDTGLEWVSNIGDSDGIGDHLNATSSDEIKDYVDGLSAHLLMSYGPVNFFAEYVGALQSFEPTEISYRGEGARPEAWGFEIGYNTELLSRETLFSIGYQGSNEAVDLEIPETRYLASARFSLLKNTSLAFEYSHDKDYDSGDGGTDENADTATMQLAVEF